MNVLAWRRRWGFNCDRGTFCVLALFHFYDYFNGIILSDLLSVRELLRRTIRYIIFIGVGLFGIIHELAKSETIRWPLLGGYLFVIIVSAYGMRVRAREEADDDGVNE
jgi:hypothetical protein